MKCWQRERERLLRIYTLFSVDDLLQPRTLPCTPPPPHWLYYFIYIVPLIFRNDENLMHRTQKYSTSVEHNYFAVIAHENIYLIYSFILHLIYFLIVSLSQNSTLTNQPSLVGNSVRDKSNENIHISSNMVRRNTFYDKHSICLIKKSNKNYFCISFCKGQ